MSGRRLAEAIALFFKQTPSQRDATAQMRAALPVEKGGLGLPPDNEFYDRANVMFPRRVYRGLDKSHNMLNFIEDPRHYPRAGNSYRPDSAVFTSPSELIARTYGKTYPMRLDDRDFGRVDFEGRNYYGLEFDHTDLSDVPSEIFQEIDRGDADLNDYAIDLPLIDGAGDQVAVIYRANTDKIADVVGDPEMLYEHGEPTLPTGEFVDPSDPMVFEGMLPNLPGVRIDNVIDISTGREGMSTDDVKRILQPSTVFVSRPNRLRHATATFDPFLKDWDHILAGAAGTGILLDQIPYDEQKQGALYVE